MDRSRDRTRARQENHNDGPSDGGWQTANNITSLMNLEREDVVSKGDLHVACNHPQSYYCSDAVSPAWHRASQSLTPWLRSFRGDRWTVLASLLILLLTIEITPASAAFINFQNCLSESYQTQTPLSLQFVPLYVNAVFNRTDPSFNLNVTVWGNVTGSGPDPLVNLPPANNTEYWDNPANTQGKIQDIPDPSLAKPLLTTLFNKVNVLTYEPFSQAVDFCDQLINGSCPLGPSFTANR